MLNFAWLTVQAPSVPVNFKTILYGHVISRTSTSGMICSCHDHVGIGHLYDIHWSTCIVIIIFHGHQPPWRIILVPPVLFKIMLPPSCTIVFIQAVAIFIRCYRLYSHNNKYYATYIRHNKCDIVFIYPSWGDQQLNNNSS